jgi:hypothetical protein
MTPEELNAQLQSLLNFMTESFHRSDERFERIEARLETIAIRVDQNTVLINELGVRMDQVTLQVQQTMDQVRREAETKEKKIMVASRTREERIVAAVVCPRCGARIGEPCRNPVTHQRHRGPEDYRLQPKRCHTERRQEWQKSRT